MKKPERKPVHTYEINGELVELVLDMRAKNLVTRYAAESGVEEKDHIKMIVIMFVAMVNSAALRNNSSEDMISVDDIMESDIDLEELTSIVKDVKDEAYRMEYKEHKDSNDLYADEVADNETPREGVS